MRIRQRITSGNSGYRTREKERGPTKETAQGRIDFVAGVEIPGLAELASVRATVLNIVATTMAERISNPSEWQGIFTSPEYRRIPPHLGTEIRSELAEVLRCGIPCARVQLENERGSRSGEVLINDPLDFWVKFTFGLPDIGLGQGNLPFESFDADKHSRQFSLVKHPNKWDELPVVKLQFLRKEGGRRMSQQDVLRQSGLEPTLFEKIVLRSYLISIFVKRWFRLSGLELWEGKLLFDVGGLHCSFDLDKVIATLQVSGYRLHINQYLVYAMVQRLGWFMGYQNVQELILAKNGHGQSLDQAIVPPPKLPREFLNLFTDLQWSVGARLTENPLFDAKPLELESVSQDLLNYFRSRS